MRFPMILRWTLYVTSKPHPKERESLFTITKHKHNSKAILHKLGELPEGHTPITAGYPLLMSTKHSNVLWEKCRKTKKQKRKNITVCKGGSKTQNGRFPSKIALHLKKVLQSFLCVNTVSDKVARHSWPIYPCKMVSEDVLYYVKIWPKLTHLFKNANFQSIFVRSASAVTTGEKINYHE